MTASRPRAVSVRAIVFLSVAAFASAATLRIADPLLPRIAAEFDVTTGRAGAVVTAFAASYGLLQIVFGPLAERVGKYLFVGVMALACSAATFACAAVSSLDALTLARFASGAMAGPLIPISLAFLGDAVPFGERQPVLARFLTGQILGILFGQAAGGAIGEYLDWRWAFVLLGVVFLVSGLAILAECRGSPRLRERTRREGAAGSGYFAGISLVLRRAWARRVLAITFAEGMLVYGPFAFIAAYLHQRLGVPLVLAGLIVAAYGLGGILYAASVRVLVARLGERGLVAVGGASLCAGYLALTAVPAAAAAVPLMIALGVGYYMFHNTLQTQATQMAPEVRGVGMALFATAFFIGQSAGVAIAAAAFDLASPRWVFGAAAIGLAALAVAFRRVLASRPATP